MKYCPNCGAQLTEEMNNCPNCGTNLKSNEGVNNNVVNEQPVQSQVSGNTTGYKPTERGIAMCIILTLVTCGIYGLYWFYTLTEDTNAISTQNKTASGGMAILFCLLTCGIYTWYWLYKTGKKLEEVTGEDESVLYLILGVFGLGIVSYCLAQDKLNKLSK